MMWRVTIKVAGAGLIQHMVRAGRSKAAKERALRAHAGRERVVIKCLERR